MPPLRGDFNDAGGGAARTLRAKNQPTAEKPPPCWQRAARDTGNQPVRRSLLSLKSRLGMPL